MVRIAELLAREPMPARYWLCARSLEQWAPDYAQVLDELAALLVRIAIKQVVSDVEGDELYAPELLERLAARLAPEDVQLFYQTAIVGRRDLPLAPDPRIGFEMTLLRMLAFRPPGETGKAVPSTPSTRAAPPAATPAAPPRAVPAPEGENSWAVILSALDLQAAARQLASHCVLLGRRGPVVRLALDPRNQLLRTRAQEEKLAQALSRYFGEPIRLEFEVTVADVDTPAQAGHRASQQELEAARRALEGDPGAQALRERFGATLIPDTVRPLKS